MVFKGRLLTLHIIFLKNKSQSPDYQNITNYIFIVLTDTLTHNFQM